MKVAIATNSRDKIGGVQEAISRFFCLNTTEIEIYSQSVDSGVPEQPFETETYQGALNRVNRVRQACVGMDFYISCEAGIESSFGQYFNVQVICIFDSKTQSYFWGKSAGWAIPSEAVETIKNENLDTYLRAKGISCIEELLGKEHSRKAAVAQATELALASGKLRNS